MILIVFRVIKKIEEKNKKISVISAVFLSLFMGCYSFVCTAHPYVMDKRVYSLKFSSDIYLGQVKEDSIGLWGLENLIHKVTYNPDVLFFIIATL